MKTKKGFPWMLASGGLAVFAAAGFFLERTVIQKSAEAKPQELTRALEEQQKALAELKHSQAKGPREQAEELSRVSMGKEAAASDHRPAAEIKTSSATVPAPAEVPLATAPPRAKPTDSSPAAPTSSAEASRPVPSAPLPSVSSGPKPEENQPPAKGTQEAGLAAAPAAVPAPKTATTSEQAKQVEAPKLQPAAMSVAAVEISAEHRDFFENKIRPILANHCLECHSSEKGKIKGGFNMDSREEVLKGGDNGVALKPGDVSGSSMIAAVEWKDDLQMPPKKKLSDEQIADLKAWVAMGAPDPRQGAGGGPRATKKDHWAFQLVAKTQPPRVKNAGWCKTPIDAFVLAKLEEKEMLPADPPETGSSEDQVRKKEALLRRAYFDLVGVPPSPQQIKDYVFDQSPNAFEKVLDGLLASPQYGERWARHWMDTARYSDTTGSVGNMRGSDYRYAYAWGYRDWLIKAINDDMPYDQFIINQLAADRVADNSKENLAALGFLTVGQRFNDRDDIINDRIDVVGRGFLGLTLACARCHDHKFDPIKQADYYALRGVFASLVEPREGPVVGGDPNSPAYQEFEEKLEQLHQKAFATVYLLQKEESDKFRTKASAYFRAAKGLKDRTDLEGKKMADALVTEFKLDGRFVTDHLTRHFNPNDPFWGPFVKLSMSDANREKMIEEMLNGKSRTRYNPLVIEYLKGAGTLPSDLDTVAALLEKFCREKIEPAVASTFKLVANPATDVAKSPEKPMMDLVSFPLDVVPGSTLKTQYDVMQLVARWGLTLGGSLERRSEVNKINEFKLTAKGGPIRAMVVEDLPKAVNSEIYPRGNKPKPGDKVTTVPRRFIEILSVGGAPEPFKDGSGRYELAKAIASKTNPMTARVMVNRIWMYHFGEGLVRTPDDLGNQAGKPTHPELLDYLTAWFTEDLGAEKKAWSVKALHKLIMMSSAYQQDSRTIHLAKHQKIDAGNSLLWRSNVRRLDFEAFRDSMLTMAGTMDKTMYGPPVNLVSEPYSYRRSVYGYIDRAAVPDLLNQFDMASALEPNTKRTVSIVPQQALFLMNNPFSISVAQRVVKRPEVVQAFTGSEAALRDRNTVRAIFQIVLQRTPTRQEYDMALEFVRQESKIQEAVQAATKKSGMDAYDRAIKQMEREKNDGGARKAIVNEGTVVLRKALSPWESLVQSLMFCNEAAYLN